MLHTLQKSFKYIENESFSSTFGGLFSEINLDSEKLGKDYIARNAKLCTIITKIAEGIAQFSTHSDVLGDAYEYLIGQFAAVLVKRPGNSTRRSRFPPSCRKSLPWTVKTRPPVRS